MNGSIAFVLIVLAGAAALLISEVLRADLVALLVLVALGVSGVLTPQETLSGFSRSAVITIIAIFILTAGLDKAGVTRTLAELLVRLGGNTEARMLVVLMAAGAALSLFMNNIAAGSVLLPVASGIARERGISPSKLMMPLAFGTLLGGMATLLTTVNILASAILKDNDYQPFGLFDFAPIGIPVMLVGILYMVLVGRRWLPRRGPADWERLMQSSRKQLADIYGLRERWMQAHVPDQSPLAGRTLAEAGLGMELGVNVIAITSDGKARWAPPPSELLQPGANLFLQARTEQVALLQQRGLQVDSDTADAATLRSREMGLYEVILAPRSRAADKTLKAIHFREKYGLNVIAIWQQGRPRRVGLGDMPLQPGDALLVLGPARNAQVLQSEPDFIVLTDIPGEEPRRSKAPYAVGIMLLALVLGGLGILQIAEAMLAGALLMVLVGALTMDEAYQAIEWRAVFLIAGMLPLGLAMSKTGAAALLGNLLVGMFGGGLPIVVAAALIVAGVLFTQIMSGQAAVVILAPIAIAAAVQVGADPRPVTLAVALACSMAFLTPVAHPVNVLVMGPGGYKVKDYARVGALLTVVSVATVIFLLALLYRV